MKQVLLQRGVQVVEVPSPGLGGGQVLVEVGYSFISTGTEMAGVRSSSEGMIAQATHHPSRIGRVLEMVQVDGIRKTLIRVRARMAESRAIGYSCAGRVLKVGPGVSGLAPGDHVACAGGGYAQHAEVVSVPANLVAKLPEGCSLRWASGATIATIALQGLRRAALGFGETAAVVGLGLLGQMTLQLLAASGVRAVGFDLSADRVDESRALGFSDCFTFAGQEAVEAVIARTGQRGADATLITAATKTPGICQNAMEMTRKKGKVVVVGDVPLTFDRSPFYAKEIEFLISCSYGPGRYDPSYEEAGRDYPYAYVRWTENRNLQAVLQAMADGHLRMDPLISAEFPVDQAEQAFASLAASDELGKRPLGVVLKYPLEERSEAKLTASVAVPESRPLSGRIGVGVIGVGAFFSNVHKPNLILLADRYQVVSVCDRAGAKARDVAAQLKAAQACSDASELLANDDVQLVIVATRHDTHAPLAIEALKAGKHVFVEKPMAMNRPELEELLEAISASGRSYMLGFNRRFSPHVSRLNALLADRSSPLVVHYRVFSTPAPPESWIHSAAGGGRAIGEACHMLDLMNFLVGDGVEVAELDTVAPPAGTGGQPGDNLIASLRYADGSICVLTYSTLGRATKGNGKERIEALWDGKTFVIEDFVESFGVGCSAGGAGKSRSKGHYEELVALADCLAGKQPPPIGVEACAKATELSFRVDEACRS
jgi:predicted dehydrogenase/threonine dehydrogenase-like Zn-dependent dehydrogenase